MIQACPVQQKRQSMVKFDKVEISDLKYGSNYWETMSVSKIRCPSRFTTEHWKFWLRNCLILHYDSLLIGLPEVICAFADVLHENRKNAPLKNRKSRICWCSLIFIRFPSYFSLGFSLFLYVALLSSVLSWNSRSFLAMSRIASSVRISCKRWTQKGETEH